LYTSWWRGGLEMMDAGTRPSGSAPLLPTILPVPPAVAPPAQRKNQRDREPVVLGFWAFGLGTA
jgi:hypothetical protein